MNKAFVLGAGLGERLRPLTDQLPKPLVPVYYRPLMSYAFDHLAADLGVKSFVVNTFHLPEQYALAYPKSEHGGRPIVFRKDAPVRLETAGGLANVRDLLDDGSTFIVYNGDILTDLPLEKLLHDHQSSGRIVTLALRSTGPALHIALDEERGLVMDIRGKLGTDWPCKYLFTGIYVVEPAFFRLLQPGVPESVIPHFLALASAGQLGGVVIDEGEWWDLGSREAYLEAHATLGAGAASFPRYGSSAREAMHPEAMHPEAQVAADAVLTGGTAVGAGAVIGAGAVLEDCVIWPGATVEPGARLTRCIVRSQMTAGGSHANVDF